MTTVSEAESLNPAGQASNSEIQSRRGGVMHKYEIIIYWSNEDGAFVAEVP